MTEFAFPATITSGRGLATVTAFNVNADEPVFVASENHPHWEAILDGLRFGHPDVWELFDVAAGVSPRDADGHRGGTAGRHRRLGLRPVRFEPADEAGAGRQRSGAAFPRVGRHGRGRRKNNLRR